MTTRASILLPLYTYPFPGAWDPLYSEIMAHPNLNFTVIINPHNGPGASPLPDENYVREIPRLNAFPNVRTLGYVRTEFCKRVLDEVCKDVETYAGWPTESNELGLAVQGIFFDETPNVYLTSIAFYLEMASKTVKGSRGILGDKLVIHNPGCMPDARLLSTGADVIAVLEECYEQYESRWKTLQEQLSASNYPRCQCAYVVHAVPWNRVKEIADQLRFFGGYIFLTDLTEHYYTRFAPSWSDFVEAINV